MVALYGRGVGYFGSDKKRPLKAREDQFGNTFAIGVAVCDNNTACDSSVHSPPEVEF